MNIPARQRGFTLLEVMAALLLLGLFTLASYRGLNTVLAADRHGRAELERWQTLSRAFERIQTDLGSVAPGLAGAASAPRGFRLQRGDAGAAELAWDRLLPQDQIGGVQRIGYRYEQGRLQRLAWREGAPDSEAPDRAPVLHGLRRLEWRCLDDAGAWQTVWPASADAQASPRAVEILLETGEGAVIRRVLLAR